MMRFTILALSIFCGAFLPALAADKWSVALTFDDLPMTGDARCPAADIVHVNEAILESLRRRNAKATAFAVPGNLCQGAGPQNWEAVTSLWRAAGHGVGNHTFTHPSYSRTPKEIYLADAQRAHDALEPLLVSTGQKSRWFRPPLLHMGPDRERKQALETWLSQRGYKLGAVTIDNQEWLYAAAYQIALTREDRMLAARIVDAYLEHIAASAQYARILSQRTFGREIAHTLLLHVNRLNADHGGRVFDALSASGARFLSLDEALSDPAYSSADAYVGPRGLSWPQRWAITKGDTPPPEPREHDWIAAMVSQSR